MILVLSLTLTNIMLAIPKPPTKIENRPITPPATFTTLMREANPFDNNLVSFNAKLFASRGFNLLYALMIPVSSSISASFVTPSAALTAI